MLVENHRPSMSEIPRLYDDRSKHKIIAVSPSQLARPSVPPLSPAVIRDSKHIAQAPLSSTSTSVPLCSPSAASTVSTVTSHASTTPGRRDVLAPSDPHSPPSGQTGSKARSHRHSRMSYNSRDRRTEEGRNARSSEHHSPASDAHRTTIHYAEDEEPDTNILQKNALRLTVIKKIYFPQSASH